MHLNSFLYVPCVILCHTQILVFKPRFLLPFTMVDFYLQFIGYIGIFQGLSPIRSLTVVVILEQPNGNEIHAVYNDNGQGMF